MGPDDRRGTSEWSWWAASRRRVVSNPESTSMSEGVSEERGLLEVEGGVAELNDELRDAVPDLRAAFVRPAAPDIAAEHLARMKDAAPVVPFTAAPALSRRRVGAAEPSWARRALVAASALVVGAVGVGGLGMAGALPGPVQDTVADIGERLGLDIPDSHGVVPGDEGDDTPAEAPGVTGETPGQQGETPGQLDQTPANGAEPPGQVGATPGQSESTPGQSGSAPGQSGNPAATAPAQSGDPSATAPGQSGNPSETAPGSSGNPSETAPGQFGDPGATAPVESGTQGQGGQGQGGQGQSGQGQGNQGQGQGNQG
jgi:hypothetical protein